MTRLGSVLLVLQMLLLVLMKLGVSGDMMRHWGHIEAMTMIVTRLGGHCGHLCLVTHWRPHSQAHRRLLSHGLGLGVRSAGRLGRH